MFKGITRTNESTEILYARQKLVLVAKAYGLQAIDMVYIMYKGMYVFSINESDELSSFYKENPNHYF